MIRVFVLFFLFVSIAGNATIVEGVSQAYANKRIELIKLIDEFNGLEKVMASQTIDQNGNFKFEFEAQESQKIVLRIGAYKTYLYVAPKATYKLKIDKFDESSAPPLSKIKLLSYDLLAQDTDSINYRIVDVGVCLSKFQDRHYGEYLHNSFKKSLPELEASLDSIETKSDFITQYKRYVLARQKLLGSHKKRELFEQYIEHEAFLKNNSAYTEFFNDFYKKWFYQYNSDTEILTLNSAIKNQNLDSLKWLMNQNDYVQRTEIIEQVILTELYREATEAKKYSRENLAALIKQLGVESKSESIKENCRRKLEKLMNLKVGDQAPDFTFNDQYGNEISLNQLKGKYVYLDFWTTWCDPCIRSFRILDSLNFKFKDSLQIVSINLNANEDIYNDFIQQKNIDWISIWAGNDTKLKDQYELYAFPAQYLIDKNGKLMQAPAYAPGEGISSLFAAMFDPNRNKKIEIWDWGKEMPKKKE